MKNNRKAIAVVLTLAVVFAMGCAGNEGKKNADAEKEKVEVVEQPAADGKEFVDLGLPSGTLWATCNVGADSPEEFGDYFAWGETSPKTDYNRDTYQSAGLSVLEPADDAASVNWGDEWCIPTKEQWEELYQNTEHFWTDYNGVKCRLFVASNQQSLFLPAADMRWEFGNRSTTVNDGHYWSSTAYEHGESYAWTYTFFALNDNMEYLPRHRGHSVRAVRVNTK